MTEKETQGVVEEHSSEISRSIVIALMFGNVADKRDLCFGYIHTLLE